MKEKKISIFSVPLIISSVLSGFVLFSLFNVNEINPVRFNIVLFVCAVFLLWLVLYFFDTQKIKKEKQNKHIVSFSFIIIFLFIALALYLVKIIWLSGYLTLTPFYTSLQGSSHLDTMYHSAIAESIKNYGYPSILLNNANYLPYHVGSHFLLAFFSKLFGIPAFLTYNYLYPILTLPLYPFLLLLLVLYIKEYRGLPTTFRISELIFILVFFTGFYSTATLEDYAIWKGSFIDSESFLFAQIFLVVFGVIFFKSLHLNLFKKRVFSFVFLIFIIPFFIFLLSAMKISVGFLFVIMVMYFIFRKYTISFKHWILLFFYLTVFYIVYKLFSFSAANSNIFKPFAFASYFNSTLGIFGGYLIHFFFLLFFGILFSIVYLQKNFKGLLSIKNKSTLWFELYWVVTIAAILPSLLLDIGGGSAVYFSYVQEVLALVLLLGFGYVLDLPSAFHLPRRVWQAVLIFLVYIFIANTDFNLSHIKPFSSLPQDVRQKTLNSSLLKNVQEINSLTKGNKNRYAIFLDDSAEIFRHYNREKNYPAVAVYFYPATVGTVVVNGFYSDGLKVYLSNGLPFGYYYGSAVEMVKDNVLQVVSKLTLSQAKEKAKQMGKKYIIHIYENTFKVIPL